ncbi:MAG: hypothetical protein ACOX5Z_07555 [Desulfobulbus sp.]|jgi:hypothetical protein
MEDAAKSGSELIARIDEMLDAIERDGFEAMEEHRSTLVMMYVQAMVEEWFDADRVDWLNELLAAVQENDLAGCRRVLARGDDPDVVFAAAGLAAMVAGFFHHDECMTVVQGVGLQALLRRDASG